MRHSNCERFHSFQETRFLDYVTTRAVFAGLFADSVYPPLNSALGSIQPCRRSRRRSVASPPTPPPITSIAQVEGSGTAVEKIETLLFE